MSTRLDQNAYAKAVAIVTLATALQHISANPVASTEAYELLHEPEMIQFLCSTLSILPLELLTMIDLARQHELPPPRL